MDKNEELERAFQDLRVAVNLKVTYEPPRNDLYWSLTAIQAVILAVGLIAIILLIIF